MLQELYVWVLILLCQSTLGVNTGRHKGRIDTSTHFKYHLDYRWSAWSEFTSCSRSCGLGVKSRYRTCYKYGNKPEAVEGQLCKGRTRDYRICNSQACPSGSRDFRALQCSFFNGQKYTSGGRMYQWKPFNMVTASPSCHHSHYSRRRNKDEIDPCALICSAQGHASIVVQFSPQVVDGTPCGTNPHSVCVAGNCAPVGCDNKLFSNKSRDWCGVCGGNNSTCRRVSSKIFRRVPPGYTELVRIPRNARHIKIAERPASAVSLALQNARGILFIHGYRSRTHTTETKLVAGTVIYYSHPNHSRGLELLRAEGPINETLIVMSFARKRNSSVVIFYEYSISTKWDNLSPNRNSFEKSEKSYRWESLLYQNVLKANGLAGPPTPVLPSRTTSSLVPVTYMPVSKTRFTELSRTKNKNKPRGRPVPRSPYRKLARMANSDRVIAIVQLKKSISGIRPGIRRGVRNKEKHPQYHRRRTGVDHRTVGVRGKRTNPNVTNGNDTNTQKPKVDRKSDTERTRSPSLEKKPVFVPNVEENDGFTSRRRHDSHVDEEEGHVNLEGVDRAEALQVDLSVQVASRKTKKAEKGSKSKKSSRGRGNRRKNQKKYEWQANNITPCSSSCEVGTQVKFFSCYRKSGVKVADSYCDANTKPESSYHTCTNKPCKPRWVPGIWGECSVTCGEGVQTRTVRCWQMMAPGFDSTVRDYSCDTKEKPESVRECRDVTSCEPQWEMSGWEECSTACGYGIQTRHIRCSRGNGDLCDAGKKPLDKRSCRNKACVNQWYTSAWSSCSGTCGVRQRKMYCRNARGRMLEEKMCDLNTKPLTVHSCGRCQHKWVPQEWRQCSVTCGGGVTTRRVVCGILRGGKFYVRSDTNCKAIPRPETTTRCRSAPCGPTWYTTQWSECSKACGKGVRMRDVNCYGGSSSTHCDLSKKPTSTESCNLQKCQEAACEDDGVTQCALVVTSNLCSHWFYQDACCKTCKRYADRRKLTPKE